MALLRDRAPQGKLFRLEPREVTQRLEPAPLLRLPQLWSGVERLSAQISQFDLFVLFNVRRNY